MLGFLSIDAGAIPARQRPGYAAVAISRWVPFEDAAHHVEWAGGRAMVWAWSRAALAAEDESGMVHVSPRHVWPESIFRGLPAAEGEELVRMQSGVEGRVWRGHALTASEWWPDVPDLGAWNRFRRGAGLAPAAALPLLLEPPLATTPWTKRRNTVAVGDIATRYRRHAILVALGLAAALLAAPAASALKFWVAGQQIEREMAGMDADMSRILDAREATIRDVARIHELLALRPPAGQVELLAAATTLFPQGDWQLLEWRMPDATSVEIEARIPQPDPAALARAWEASELFEKVTVELGQSPDTVRIRANVVRRPLGGNR
jgi:hypothetical protein